MDSNPWQVDGIQAFSHFNCPECKFLTKEETLFQDHAEENHPLSYVLFSEVVKDEDTTTIVKLEKFDEDENISFDSNDLKISDMKTSLKIEENCMEKSEIIQSCMDGIQDPSLDDKSDLVFGKISNKMVKKSKKKTKNSICNQCGEKFDDKRELKGHVLSVHKEKELYRCSICNAWKTTFSLMKMHIVSDHKKENLLNCKSKELIKMNLLYKLEKSQTCDQCGEKFDNKRDLKGHILSVHEEKKVFKCSICDKCFTHSGKMKTHLVIVHKKENILNYKPKQLLNMNLVHKIEKAQICDKCDEKFDNK